MVFRIGICDDEAFQIKLNYLMLQQIAFDNDMQIELNGFRTCNALFEHLRTETIDILFLDIDLGGESGIKVAVQLMEQYPEIVVIFVTGHREYACEAFEVEAMGYLVKPYDINKMERILKKAMIQVEGRQQQKTERHLVITHENVKKRIPVSEILYIRRSLSRSILHTVTKDYVVYETITALYEKLGEGFLRINQGEVVSRRHIADIKKNTVYLKDGNKMEIGRTYCKEVKEEFYGRRENW